MKRRQLRLISEWFFLQGGEVVNTETTQKKVIISTHKPQSEE
jgi:hypothetical protein